MNARYLARQSLQAIITIALIVLLNRTRAAQLAMAIALVVATLVVGHPVAEKDVPI